MSRPYRRGLGHHTRLTTSPRARVVTLRQVEAAGWCICLVVHDHDVVLRLPRKLEIGAEITAVEIMRPGPATYRPDALVASVVALLRRRRVSAIPAARPDGTLTGWMKRGMPNE